MHPHKYQEQSITIIIDIVVLFVFICYYNERAVLGSIVVVGVLTRSTCFHSVCDLKATQMNLQSNLIRELILYEFELTHITVGSTKKHLPSEVRKRSCGKDLDDQARSGRTKSLNSKAMIKFIEATLVSTTKRVSGELSISQPCVVRLLHDHCECIRSCWIMPQVIKILQNFWLDCIQSLWVFQTRSNW